MGQRPHAWRDHEQTGIWPGARWHPGHLRRPFGARFVARGVVTDRRHRDRFDVQGTDRRSAHRLVRQESEFAAARNSVWSHRRGGARTPDRDHEQQCAPSQLLLADHATGERRWLDRGLCDPALRASATDCCELITGGSGAAAAAAGQREGFTVRSFREAIVTQHPFAMRSLPSLRGSAAMLSAFVLALACLVRPSAVLAQQRLGAVRGIVRGPSGPVFGARVAIDIPPRVAVADERGAYTLRGVPAGHYDILITALGYEPIRSAVDVVANQTANVDVLLRQGSLMLSSVVTTATRMPTAANKLATTVNVLTPYQIQTSPARESQDLLREIPGVELPRTSSLVGGTAQIVSIRGVDEGRTAVLFDGFPINDAWGEWIDWGRVSKGLLDRVEVVEGGTSSLYGNGAMGGVISFFSRPLAPGAANMLIEGGSRDIRHGFLSAGIPVYGAITANVSGDYQEGGGYNLIEPSKRGTIDQVQGIIQRNAYARLNYAP